MELEVNYSSFITIGRSKKMKMKCIKETEGFTLNRKYKLLAVSAEWIKLKNDLKAEVIILESNFEPII